MASAEKRERRKLMSDAPGGVVNGFGGRRRLGERLRRSLRRCGRRWRPNYRVYGKRNSDWRDRPRKCDGGGWRRAGYGRGWMGRSDLARGARTSRRAGYWNWCRRRAPHRRTCYRRSDCRERYEHPQGDQRCERDEEPGNGSQPSRRSARARERRLDRRHSRRWRVNDQVACDGDHRRRRHEVRRHGRRQCGRDDDGIGFRHLGGAALRGSDNRRVPRCAPPRALGLLMSVLGRTTRELVQRASKRVCLGGSKC